jgi:hypothetical protein
MSSDVARPKTNGSDRARLDCYQMMKGGTQMLSANVNGRRGAGQEPKHEVVGDRVERVIRPDLRMMMR